MAPKITRFYLQKKIKSIFIGYIDSNYAGNIENECSTIGFVFQLGNSLVSWHSKRQPTIALSNTEEEYQALSNTIRELVWLHSSN